MTYFIEALYVLYPEVVITRDDIAYDVNGNMVQYDAGYVQDYANMLDCANKAKQLLNQTDWTQAVDCPLVNKADFTSYRAVIRDLARNPVANAVFPELPTEQW